MGRWFDPYLLQQKGIAMTRHRRGLFQGLLAALLCLTSLPFAIPAQARMYTVCPSGCDFATIAAALQEADDGDAITVEAGNYAGGFAIEKNVDLRGAGRDKTTIQGTSAASVIRVGSRANVSIEGVTITGGGGSRSRFNDLGGGGILNEGELILIDSNVSDNAVATGIGGGVYSGSSKTLKIVDSVIQRNRAADGGGLFIRDGDVVIEDTIILANRSTRNGGGIRHEGAETLRLERCDIIDNVADFSGGGVSTSSALVVVDSEVFGNRALNAGGFDGGRKLLKFVGSTISDNSSRGSGGGIRVGEGGVDVIDSTVEKNQTQANGAGIFAAPRAGDVSLRGSTVSGNVAAQDGGGILTDSAEVILDNSTITSNQAGRDGGGIYSRTTKKGLIKLRNGSAIIGNQPNQCAPVGLRC